MAVLVWKQGVFRRIVGTLIFWGTENRLAQYIYIYFYLKSALVEYAPLGKSTMHVHFVYYTEGRAAAHKHAKY